MEGWHRVTKLIDGKLHDYWQRITRVGTSATYQTRYIGPSTAESEQRSCEMPADTTDKPAPPNVTRIPPTNVLFQEKARKQRSDQDNISDIDEPGTSQGTGYSGALNRQRANHYRAMIRA